jgi:hypothetical protein
VHHAQVEAGSLPTTPIYTSGGTASRAADRLDYAASGNVSDGRYRIEFDLIPLYGTQDAPAALHAVGIGADADNRVSISIDTSENITLDLVAGGTPQASITGTVDIGDGGTYHVKAVAKADDVRLYVGGVLDGTPDTSAAATLSPTTIFVGTYLGTASHLAIWAIHKLRIYEA